MNDLRPCPACRRHVRIDETACPFCSVALTPAVAPTVAAGRLTRAAVFAAGAALATGAAGCGGPQKTENEPPPATADAAPVQGGEADAAVAPPPPPPPDHGTPMPYGAPPARDRLV